MNSKPWYKSKTVWFNVLTIASAVFAGLGGLLPTLGPVLPDATYQIILFIVGFINLLLRSVTKDGILFTKPKG